MNVYEKLLQVQKLLKAPKNQTNTFGNYKYRSAEDILEAAKPILFEVKALVILSDENIVLGEHKPLTYTEEVYDTKKREMVAVTRVTGSQRFYVRANAVFIDVETNEKISVFASAREDENKKGMDDSQITGSASSYARKYALNGLFDIDDTKDSDATNTHGKEDKEEIEVVKATPKQIEMLSKNYVGDNLKKLLEANKIDKLEDISMKKASEIIGKLMAKKEGK